MSRYYLKWNWQCWSSLHFTGFFFRLWFLIGVMRTVETEVVILTLYFTPHIGQYLTSMYFPHTWPSFRHLQILYLMPCRCAVPTIVLWFFWNRKNAPHLLSFSVTKTLGNSVLRHPRIFTHHFSANGKVLEPVVEQKAGMQHTYTQTRPMCSLYVHIYQCAKTMNCTLWDKQRILSL